MRQRVDYTSIEWEAAALIIVDVQNDFVDGVMPIGGTAEILPNLTSLLSAFRAAERPIVHIIRLYPPGDSDVDLVRRADIEAGAHIAAPGTIGARIPASLTMGIDVELDVDALLLGRPQHLTEDEVLIYKPRWSAFHRTSLTAWLASRGVTSVVVAGCNLPNCPRSTLFDATERDLRAAVVVDAVSQATPERLGDLALIGVRQHTVKEVQRHLGLTTV